MSSDWADLEDIRKTLSRIAVLRTTTATYRILAIRMSESTPDSFTQQIGVKSQVQIRVHEKDSDEGDFSV